MAELTAGGFLVPTVVYAPPERLDLQRIRTRGGDYAAGELAEAMGDVFTQGVWSGIGFGPGRRRSGILRLRDGSEADSMAVWVARISNG